MIETETIKITVDDASVERAGKKVLKLSDSLKIVHGSAVLVDSRFIKLNQGLTKSQANMLSQLKQAGANTKQMKEFANVLERFNKIAGVNPFDKTTNPLAFYQKQNQELQNSTALSQKYSDLTKSQIADLSRAVEFAKQKAQFDGLSTKEKNAYVKDFRQQLVDEMRSINATTEGIKQQNAEHAKQVKIQQDLKRQAEENAAKQKELADLHERNRQGNFSRLEAQHRKEVEAWRKKEAEKLQIEASMGSHAVSLYYKNQQEKIKADARSQQQQAKESVNIGPDMAGYNKSLNDRAKATDYVTKAEERLAFQTEEMKKGLTTASANQLYNYRNKLIESGQAMDVVSKKVDNLRGKLAEKQKVSPFAQMQKDIHSTSREMDRLARGLSVQMGDVAVSLASGMNPLMVMIQQGRIDCPSV